MISTESKWIKNYPGGNLRSKNVELLLVMLEYGTNKITFHIFQLWDIGLLSMCKEQQILTSESLTVSQVLSDFTRETNFNKSVRVGLSKNLWVINALLVMIETFQTEFSSKVWVSFTLLTQSVKLTPLHNCWDGFLNKQDGANPFTGNFYTT